MLKQNKSNLVHDRDCGVKISPVIGYNTINILDIF